MLEACALTKRYSGVTAVKDVSFALKPSQILGYLGPNGSGKSTTVKMLIGLVEPSSGTVRFKGEEIQQDPVEFRRHVGYVPEEPHLYPFLSGREYLQLVGRLRGIRPQLFDEKADALLTLFGLAGSAEQSIGSYSKGMRHQHSPTRRLASQFFRRFFDNDLVSPHGDGHEHIATILAVVAVPGLFVSVFLLLGYTSPLLSPGERLLTAVPHKFLLFGCSMAVVALVTCVEWDALSLDARDEAILGPLPLPRQTIVKAKLVALSLFLALFAAAANAIPAFAWPVVFLSTVPIGLGRALWVMSVHVMASLLASTLGFLVVLASRETVRGLVGDRVFQRVSAPLQFAAVLSLTSVLLLLPAVPARSVMGWLSSDRTAYFIPPLWFVGLEDTFTANTILNAPGMDVPPRWGFWTPRRDRVARAVYLAHASRFRRLASVTAVGLAGVGLLAAVAFLEGTRRRATADVAARTDRLRRLVRELIARTVVRDPQRQAGFFFTLHVLTRSAEHRLHFAGYLAAGSAAVLVLLGPSLLQHPPGGADPVPRALFAVQMMLTFFVVAGLRAIGTRPATLTANWVFQVCWTGDVRRYQSGVRRSYAVILAGVLLVLAPFHALWLGRGAVVAHFFVGWVAALLAAELMVLRPHRVPFTCATASNGSLKKWWLAYVFAFVAYTSGVSAIEERALQNRLVDRTR